ncbi:MAG: FhaA domain-containing protein, partial [Actinomycetota bacterium]
MENGLGRMVEGVFSRAFKSNVRPIEIGRRMVREIDAN